FGGFLGQFLARGLSFLGAHALGFIGLLILTILPRLFLATALLLLVFFLFAFGLAAILAHVEAVEDIVHGVAKAALIVDKFLQTIEIAPGTVLDQRTPKLHEVSRGGGWR